MEKMITNFNLGDGTNMKVIHPIAFNIHDKWTDKGHYNLILGFSRSLFGDAKFNLMRFIDNYYDYYVRNSERWENNKLTGVNTPGSKNYSVAVVLNSNSIEDDYRIFDLSADSEKAAYNKVRKQFNDNDFIMYIYDKEQDKKLVNHVNYRHSSKKATA